MNKWVTGHTPEERAAVVAADSIGVRLKAVRRYLKRSVKRPNEPENAHQLRVWSRRSEAALSLYSDMLPRRLLKHLRRIVRKLRRAAGRVRDCDVFATQVAGQNGKWPEGLKKERVRAQRKLVTLFDRLDAGRKLKTSSTKMIERLEERNESSTETFAERGRDSLRPIARAFFDTVPRPADDEKALHRFRIAGKDLRYAIELLAGAFPISFRDEVYPVLSNLQEKLGHINDLVVARDRLRERTENSHDPAELSDLRRRLAAAENELSKGRADFHRWWTPELRESLQGRFNQYLGEPQA